MHARIVTGQAQPDKIDEATSAFEQQILPSLGQERGFQRATLYADRRTGKFVAVSEYASEDDLTASEAGFQQRTGMMAGLLSGPPSAETYEVVVQG